MTSEITQWTYSLEGVIQGFVFYEGEGSGQWETPNEWNNLASIQILSADAIQK